LPSDGCDPKAILDGLGLQPENYILAVGRLVPEKGFDDLIDAFEASDQPEGRKLAIAGNADHETDYVRALRMRASDRVIFLNFQPRPVLKCLYENCGLFVMPSYHEGLPIAALEAASCAAPMILSDIAANRDLGLSATRYFPVGDIERLRHMLEGTHQSEAAEAQMVKARFDWDKSASSTAALYRSFEPAPAIAMRKERIGTRLVD
jgi:glycosyltransferase involved in cell wall biosynthesis